MATTTRCSASRATRPTTRSSARTASWRASTTPTATPTIPTAEERFKEVNGAYEMLRDPERRRRYDVFGEDGARAGGGPGRSRRRRVRLRRHLRRVLRRRPVRQRRGQAGPPRAPDAEAVVELDLAQAAFGTTATVDVRLPVACERCEGSGCEPGTHPARCDVCGGAGEVRQVRRSILGQIVTAAPCVACSATGSRIPTPCRDCRGDGRVRSSRDDRRRGARRRRRRPAPPARRSRPGRAARRRARRPLRHRPGRAPTRASSATATTSCTCARSRSRRPRSGTHLDIETLEGPRSSSSRPARSPVTCSGSRAGACPRCAAAAAATCSCGSTSRCPTRLAGRGGRARCARSPSCAAKRSRAARKGVFSRLKSAFQ